MADFIKRLQAAVGDTYRIEDELGAGGMATVYLAKDLKLHRHGVPRSGAIRQRHG